MTSPEGIASAEDAIDWSFRGLRVCGRLVDARDRDLYRALYTSPQVMAEIGPTMTVEEADAVFELACRHNCKAMSGLRARYWMLADIRSDAAVGIASLVRERPGAEAMEVGVMLLPQYQRCGLGTDAFSGVVDLARSIQWQPPLRSLFARHSGANRHAGRLPESCGFSAVAASASDIRWNRTLSTSC